MTAPIDKFSHVSKIQQMRPNQIEILKLAIDGAVYKRTQLECKFQSEEDDKLYYQIIWMREELQRLQT